MCDTKKTCYKQVLVGFAIDVSGSMQKSINNKNKNMSRLETFKNSLQELSKETKRIIEAYKKEGLDASINIFAYAFGLKETDCCDLLSLLEMERQLMPGIKSNIQHKFSDPYQELADISSHYGVRDMEKYTQWGRDVFTPTEARQLANRLYEYPIIAEKLTSLLPASFSEIEKHVKSDTAKGTALGVVLGAGLAIFTGGLSLLVAGTSAAAGAVGGKIAKDNSIKEERRKLKPAEDMAHELANASDGDIRKILLRAVGSDLKDKLCKHGNTLMPLEKLADLLESKGGQLEMLEPLIYGNTPMRSTLETIEIRFRQELEKLPMDTVAVLFILSDGEPTDGNPNSIAETLKSQGINIISCFVTNQDIVEPRCLFTNSFPQWSDGAKLMFDMASSIKNDSVFIQFLSELKWKTSEYPKLFSQLNHSEVLDEFIRVVLCPFR